MLQVNTFGLDEAEKVNKFVETVRLIENGIQVREHAIIVLYDEADYFDGKEKEVALITKLMTNESALLAAQIKAQYYSLMESNTKLSPEHISDRDVNRGQMDNFVAQIYVINKMLKRDTGEPVVFGKKMYKEKAVLKSKK